MGCSCYFVIGQQEIGKSECCTKFSRKSDECWIILSRTNTVLDFSLFSSASILLLVFSAVTLGCRPDKFYEKRHVVRV